MLPAGLTGRKQWVVCDKNKIPKYWDFSLNRLNAANVIDSKTWMDYESALKLSRYYNLGYGFILSENDPYTCIDFDVKDIVSVDTNGQSIPFHKLTPDFILERQDRAVNVLATYKEVSVSGKGIHVWIEGNIGKGKRAGGIEIYSKERFIICTGKAFDHIHRRIENGIVITEFGGDGHPITNQDDFLGAIMQGFPPESDQYDLADGVEIEPDSIIIERAMRAENGEKFKTLARGDWQYYNYPSQSEADLSLLSMLTFYSESNSQVKRIFRMTELGKRDKAVLNDKYLDRTLKGIRSRQFNEKAITTQVSFDAILNRLEQKNDCKSNDKRITNDTNDQHIVSPNLPVCDNGGVRDCFSGVFNSLDVGGHILFNSWDFQKTKTIDYPPGIIGETARFIYNSSPRPVKEVSIVGALGLFAGVSGRVYHLGQTGLNLYLVLVAQSGVGKEAMHSGVSLIINKLRKYVNDLDKYVDQSDYVSGPALMKAFGNHQCFVNLRTEFGELFSDIADSNKGGPAASLKSVMLSIYQKSGPHAIVGGLKYSDKDKNTEAVRSVCYSMIGETTPDTLYESITEQLMSNGFVSRLTFLRYEGIRVGHNYNQNFQLDANLFDRLCGYFNYCINTDSQNNHIEVTYSQRAWILQFDFSLYCDQKINENDRESHRQMYNRAHLKAVKIAALLAAADNPGNPVIQYEHLEWAINLVLIDIKSLCKKLEDGDIGVTDDSRIRRLKSIIIEYRDMDNETRLIKNVAKLYHDAGIIPRSYIQRHCTSYPAFKTYKGGSTMALNLAIQALCDNGDLREVDKIALSKTYKINGKAYFILC